MPITTISNIVSNKKTTSDERALHIILSVVLIIILILFFSITIVDSLRNRNTSQYKIEQIDLQNFQEESLEDLNEEEFNLQEFLDMRAFDVINQLHQDIRECQYHIKQCIEYIKNSIVIAETSQRERINIEQTLTIIKRKLQNSIKDIKFILMTITSIQIISTENFTQRENEIPIMERDFYVSKDKIINKEITSKMDVTNRKILDNIVQEQANLINEKIESILARVLRSQEASIINRISYIARKILKTFSQLEKSSKKDLQKLCKTINEKYAPWPWVGNMINTDQYNNCIVKGMSEKQSDNDSEEVKLFIWQAFILSYCSLQKWPI